MGTGYVTYLRERRAYRAMLIAIESEGQNNRVVLNDSFMKYYDGGIVLREFSTATIERCVSDALFVQHAKSMHLKIMYEYLPPPCRIRTARKQNVYSLIMTREEALRAATMGGAYVMHAEDILGSIDVGKLADLRSFLLIT